MSERIPLVVTVFPCQCGVWRSTSVPMPIRYQRTRWPALSTTCGPLPYT